MFRVRRMLPICLSGLLTNRDTSAARRSNLNHPTNFKLATAGHLAAGRRSAASLRHEGHVPERRDVQARVRGLTPKTNVARDPGGTHHPTTPPTLALRMRRPDQIGRAHV